MARRAQPWYREDRGVWCVTINGKRHNLELHALRLTGKQDAIDYAATKGAIHAFTKSLAQNLVDRQIRVNCLAPGPNWTVLQPVSKPAEDVAEDGVDTPMKRPGQPEEVAPAFVFFASHGDSSYITGEILTVLGGETTQRLHEPNWLGG